MAELRRPRHTRRDANQQEIVDDLRRLGFFVLDLADIGGQALDLFVCGHGGGGEWRWLAVEVKTLAGKLTAKQKRFFERWPDAPAIVAQNVEDVLRWYRRMGGANNETNSRNPDIGENGRPEEV